MMLMAQYQFFYRLDTHQIDAVYIECKTQSTLFKDTSVYAEVNVVNPPYEVTRNHKVMLDAEGNVVGTEPSPNPVQPHTPKLYRAYHRAVVTAKRTIYLGELLLEDLTDEEIAALEAEGLTVEEIEG